MEALEDQIHALEIQAARKENQNFLQQLWREILKALFEGYAYDDTPSRQNFRFLKVLNAITEFLRIYRRKYDSHTPAETEQRIRELAEHFPFIVPEHQDPSVNEDFYTELDAFIRGTQIFLNDFHADEEFMIFFNTLGKWTDVILRTAIPSYAPPYSKKNNTQTAEIFCENYIAEEKARIRKLFLVSRGLAVYNDCMGLRSTEAGNLSELPPDQLAVIRIGILRGRYQTLKSSLRTIDSLSGELIRILDEEEQSCVTALEQNALTHLGHFSVDAVLEALEGFFSRINVSCEFLNYYMPYLERVDYPDRPLFEAIKEFYFTDLRDAGQAPAIAQALIILSNDFVTVEQTARKKLLGDKGTLNEEHLHFLLLMGRPVFEQLQTLENLYTEVTQNMQGKYSKPRKRFGQKATQYGATQFNHIRILQEMYLRVVSAHRTAEVINAAEESELLSFKFSDSEITAKEKAWKIFAEERIISSDSAEEDFAMGKPFKGNQLL